MAADVKIAVDGGESPADRHREWVKRAQKGEEEAFRMLFEEFFPKIYGTIFHLVGQVETAEDLAQATMVQAWKRLGQFDGRSAFGTWLYRIGVNTALDHLRRRKNRPMESLEVAAESGIEPAVDPVPPGTGIDGHEMANAIGQALQKLTPEHRSVFILGEIESMPYEEIGRVLNVKRGTVMSRMHYARRHLQRILRPFYERTRS
ncbi:MAG TPA: sigma-70 family RNA polymerase sigma factor [Verrucomicrobiae bacterium]|nr:sigma-70 family RNA polymerase sigma factor [Verrucomicrobiae bacterium]